MADDRAFRPWVLADAVSQVLSAADVNLVLDVGAWKGDYGRFLRECGYRGRIISFEPIDEMYLATALAAEDDPDWSVQRVALGSVSGYADLQVSASTDMSSFLPKNDFVPAPIGDVRITRIQPTLVARLDELYPGLVTNIDEPRVFVKMDTQGYDLAVMEGAAGCLGDIVGLQSELSVLPLYDGMPGYLQALATYHSLGYRLVGLFDVLRDESTLYLVECDCVMIRQEVP